MIKLRELLVFEVASAYADHVEADWRTIMEDLAPDDFDDMV